MYHHVGPARSGTIPELTISPEQFERQVRWLARQGYIGVRSSDWVRWRREGADLPEKSVLITFDDGYADLTEYALPVLCRFGFSAVVFIVTGLVGGTNLWDEAQGFGTHRLMTAEQIRKWAARGIEFGAHSRTHADLTTLPPVELVEEVVGSASELAQLVGTRVWSFAYPYGSFNAGVYECVKGVFDLAFCADDTMGGFNYVFTDPHLQRRNEVQPRDSLMDLWWDVRWGYNPIKQVRVRVRFRSRLKRVVTSSARFFWEA
jgi:peptidoglycan/xylan/chitin deacetylase (PgdA/CDA1 family)